MRLKLYNRRMSCGPEAVHARMVRAYHVKQLPSSRTIACILARNGRLMAEPDGMKEVKSNVEIYFSDNA